MGVYLVRRTLLLLVTVFGVSVIIFALMRIVPGNIADILFDSSGYIDAVQKDDVPSTHRLRWFIDGAALGALAVYFMDPVGGARRRRMAREKALALGGTATALTAKWWPVLSARSHDLADQARELASGARETVAKSDIWKPLSEGAQTVAQKGREYFH